MKKSFLGTSVFKKYQIENKADEMFLKKLFYASSHFDIQKSKKNMDSPHNYHDRYSYKEARDIIL